MPAYPLATARLTRVLTWAARCAGSASMAAIAVGGHPVADRRDEGEVGGSRLRDHGGLVGGGSSLAKVVAPVARYQNGETSESRSRAVSMVVRPLSVLQ